MSARTIRRVCVIGASGKLGRYLVIESLRRGYDVVGVCRGSSVGKLADLADRITVLPGRTNDPGVIARAVADCDAVLTVLVPWGTGRYSSGTAQAVLDHAAPDARLVFSCGWHVPRDEQDHYPRSRLLVQAAMTKAMRALRIMDINDQVEAARRIYASDRPWTLVRASTLEEGEPQGLPVWAEHVGDPLLASDRTRRVDYALFMVEALTDDSLVGRAPAIVGRSTPSALAATAGCTA